VWLFKRLVRERRGRELEVVCADIPEPDPRLPLSPVATQLWRYQGAVASPALEPGDPAVAQSLASIAEEPYQLVRWWDHAGQVAHQLGPDTVPSILAAMVHPPRRADTQSPWNWLFRIQTAAALVLARLDVPWPRRRQLLFDLALGPVDWSTSAALIALSELAIREEPARADITALFFRLLEVPLSPIRYQCCVAPLLELAPRLPGLSDAQRAVLAEWKANLSPG